MIFTVVVAGPASMPLLDKIANALRDSGRSVLRHVDHRAVAEHRAGMQDADVLVVAANFFPCTRASIDIAPRLRAIVSPFTGTDGIDEAAATERGILVANSPAPENVIGLAEATVMLMLASLYDLQGSMAVLRNSRSAPLVARLCKGKTVGLIGFGRVAREVAARLHAWGVTLLTTSPRHIPDLPAYVRAVALPELLATSDIVSIHCSLNEETRRLLDSDRLLSMKPDVLLINTARGAIIDEESLVRIARERPEMRLALDVFDTEPLPADSPLRSLPNAILTPHRVGHTKEGIAALPRLATESVERVLSGRPPQYVRNPQVLKAWLERWSSGRPA